MIRFCFIEVPKIAEKFKDHGHIKTMLDRWLFFMGVGQTTKTELSKTLVGNSLSLATAYLRLQHLSASEQKAFEKEIDQEMFRSSIFYAQQQEIKRMKAALAKAETASALEKAALAKAETALASEKLKFQNVIKKLLAQGNSPEKVATIFGISVAEVEALAKSCKD